MHKSCLLQTGFLPHAKCLCWVNSMCVVPRGSFERPVWSRFDFLCTNSTDVSWSCQGLCQFVSDSHQKFSENIRVPQSSIKCNFWRVVWKLLTQRISSMFSTDLKALRSWRPEQMNKNGGSRSKASHFSYCLFNNIKHMKTQATFKRCTAVNLTKTLKNEELAGMIWL